MQDREGMLSLIPLIENLPEAQREKSMRALEVEMTWGEYTRQRHEQWRADILNNTHEILRPTTVELLDALELKMAEIESLFLQEWRDGLETQA